MGSSIQNICEQYLKGEIDIESAADAIASESGWGYMGDSGNLSPDDEERLASLFARVLWIELGRAPGGSVPEIPFSANDIRDMAKGSFFDDESHDVPDEK